MDLKSRSAENAERGKKAKKGGKADLFLAISLLAKQYLISGDVLKHGSRGSVWSHLISEISLLLKVPI